jgi:hypothetical protein
MSWRRPVIVGESKQLVGVNFYSGAGHPLDGPCKVSFELF